MSTDGHYALSNEGGCIWINPHTHCRYYSDGPGSTKVVVTFISEKRPKRRRIDWTIWLTLAGFFALACWLYWMAGRPK